MSSSVVQFNGAGGIVLGYGGGLITGNSVSNNGLSAIGCFTPAGGYSNNVFEGNAFGPTGCVNMGQNLCAGSLCP